MNGLRFLFAMILILALTGAATAEHHEGDLLEEVEAFGDAISKAMVADDIETLLAMYAEGAISLPNYSPRMQGIEEFRQSHDQMKATGMKVTSFESSPTEAWQAGDQVIEIGTYEIKLDMAGMPIEDVGKYLTIYERDAEGALKIKVETWNTDLNPMLMGGGPMGGHGEAAGSEEEPPMDDGRGDGR